MGAIYNIKKEKIKPINIIGLRCFRDFRVLYHINFFESYHLFYNKNIKIMSH